ncbi:serine/threonine-protein kinase TAO1-like isoform X2 [Gigantopelta aegis]|uniref:serine/threonine-protein kinase TAO1-like isoform X2 n=1 Tax=Gigantopelta aegis TaxID=1735272 RepID=UPI001B887DF0|nr:serine/threonine-protein kinase TAO1-like isoform X2 [Gigantopelta aegis]
MKPGNLRDPEVVGLFSTEDPDKIFVDLREIGHGSFGAVYFARNTITMEVVAIKKMSYSGKGSQDKWQDIVKEVKFLQQLRHKNTILYKGCFLKEHTAWLVMEYCLGSASDIIEVLKCPLMETEIAAICHDALQGLVYLHSLNRIHRDVKAGNILLTENGTVKLADFGSGSLVSPANSFVGTPYWMAPEVILAMDEGQYDGKVDSWSLGITCIELAERKPPLFNMNAMSALYHIAQNDSPTLSGGEWSDEFRNFVDSCLAKSPENRPSAADCLQHAFLQRPRSPDVILELIQRTKDKVRELDKSQYRKLLHHEISGGYPHNAGEKIEVGNDDTSSVEEEAQDGSRSSSITSQNSNFTSSQSSIPSIGGAHNGNSFVPSFSASRDRSPSTGSNERHTNNFATIRTRSIMLNEIKDHEQSNDLKEQFTGYKRLRKQHQKELQQMETRFKSDMEEHKQKLDKEYEGLRQKFMREMEKLKLQHTQELEKEQKMSQQQEKKLEKDLKSDYDKAMKNFQKRMKQSYQTEKEKKKKDLDGGGGTPKKERDEQMKSHKNTLQQIHRDEEFKLEQQQKDRFEFEMRKFKRRKVLQFAQLEQKLLREELSQRKAQLEYEHNMLVRHHESTQDLEYKHLAAIQKLRDEQLRKQHESERENQKQYTARAEQDLRKKHSLEVRQQPRSLRAKVNLIRKQFHDAQNTQQKQYKALKEHILLNTPKTEQKAVVKKLKDEQVRKLASLAEQYDMTIADMLQQQNVRLDETQVAQVQDLKQRLQQELELLIAYQSKIKMQTEAQHQRERKQLEERVSLRRALLEQKMDEEKVHFQKEENERLRKLSERQRRELREFDIETVSKGLNCNEIVEASLVPDDELSIRGSMLSLTGSSSSSSFTSPHMPT